MRLVEVLGSLDASETRGLELVASTETRFPDEDRKEGAGSVKI